MSTTTINARTRLKYDTYANWKLIENTFIPFKGEICFIEIPANADSGLNEPAVVFKVGDGVKTLTQLPYGAAKAADVNMYALQDAATFKTTIENWISSKVQDSDTYKEFKIEPVSGVTGKYQLYERTVDKIAGTTTSWSAVSGSVVDVSDAFGRLADLEDLVGTTPVSDQIDAKINELDGAVTGTGFVSSISQTNGKITATLRALTAEDLPEDAYDDRYYTKTEVDEFLDDKLDVSLKGAANGLAELDTNGKVPSSQLPSYVDDVIEVDSYEDLPATGESGKIYITKDTNKQYRWSGTTYVVISESLALGETASTAYRGDRGKIAYDHAVAKGSAFASGLYKMTTNSEGHVTAATAVVKKDITDLGIPAQDTTYNEATTSAAGLMSAGDKAKLNGISANAKKVEASNINGNIKIDGVETQVFDDSDIQEELDLKANDTDLANIAKSGNVKDLIQTSGDILILDCGTSTINV